VLGCLVGAGLIVSGVSPVWATEGEPPGDAALIGGFGLGDGLEGSFDEQSGAFRFGVPAGGVNLGWDSRALGSNRHGLGDGWGLGLASLQIDGGVLVFPAAGGAYPADASSPSGLAGYTLADLRFEQTAGTLPARDDGTRGEVAYAYLLHELGGAATYFSAAGDPVAQLEPTGARADWVWADGAEHRLAELIDADGVVTALTWNLEGGELLVQPGANLAEPGAPWQVLLHDGRVAATVDPSGARTEVRTSAASGLVTGIAGPSGAQTAVQWRSHLDGVARVDRVRTLDGVGNELSSRTWRPTTEQGLSTGWPVTEVAPGTPGTGSAFSSVIGDGKTEVESTYNALGSLIRRVTSGTTGAGLVVLKDQTFEYPGTDEDGQPNIGLDQLPKHWASPTAATATAYDAEGGEREATLHTEFDEFGRLVRDLEGSAYSYDASNRVTSRTGVDGVTTRTSYWADGSRHALTADAGAGASTTFYWDGDTLVNDAHTGTSADSDDDAGTASYLIGVIRHARTVTSGDPDRPDHRTSYLGTDRHGNTTDLTDEQGQVTTQYAYTDYGSTTETNVAENHTTADASTPRVGDATRNPFQYAAGHTDPSGDQHLSTRVYDADTARFTTPDPAPMLTDYAYGGLNPITNVDPSGRAEIGDHIINGALIGVALITGFFTATSIGLPTGGMAFGAYAAWAVGAFSVIGDVASTGIAIAQIVHDAGVRFMTDEQREILSTSGIVIGVVSAVAGPIAAGIKRRYAAEDDNAWNIAFNRPNQKFDTSPVRAHQLEALLPRHVARLFGKKFEYHLDTLSSHFASSKEKLREFARSFELGEVSEVEAYDFWFAKTDDVDFNFAFEEIARFARNDVQGGLKGAQAAKRAVDAAIKAIKEDKKTIDKVMSKWLVYKTAYRDAPIDLFPAE
jgi:RHS repeat-associated protein